MTPADYINNLVKLNPDVNNRAMAIGTMALELGVRASDSDLLQSCVDILHEMTDAEFGRLFLGDDLK